MKKFFASLAILTFAANAHAGAKDGFYKATDDMKDLGEKVEQSYTQVPNPLRPFAGTIVSPVGNTIYYVAEGLDIVAQEGVEGMVKSVVASGNCLEKSGHPGEAAGCVVKLGGDAVVVIWNTAGYTATNVVDYAGETLSDVAFIWRDAFGALGDTLKAAGIPLLPEAAYIVKFVINAAGVITKVSFATVSDTGRGLVEGVAMTADSFVDVPVQLLNLKPKKAADSLVIGIGYAGCTAIDLVLFPVRLTLNLINAADHGDRRIEKCMDGMAKTAEEIRAGTYKPREPSLEDQYRN